MSRSLSVTAILATLGATACTSDEAERAGTIDLALVGQATSGAVFRLRDAELSIAPAGLVFRTEDDPDRQSISARLPAGLYTLGIAPGWRLERISGGSVETVFAVLTSEDPQPFDVVPGERTPVVLQFRADGQSVQLGEGDVDISIGVDDVPQGQSDAGVADGMSSPDATPPPPPDGGQGPDATPAFIQILSAPSGVITDNTPTIEFETSSPGDTWCFSAAVAEPCSSPYTTPPLPDGPQFFAVQTFDGSARAEVAFTVDTTPPQVQLTSEAIGLQQRRFFFSSSEPATLTCSLDSTPIAPCVSPFTTPMLPIFSSHTFRVRATDSLGLVGEASLSFTVP